MNFRTTGIMLVVLAILGAGVWWFELRAPPAPADDTTIAVLDLRPEDVTRFETRDQANTVVVQKSDDGAWRLLVPEEADADRDRVDDMIERVARLSATRSIDDAGDLADFGLVQPESQVVIEENDGETITVLIGDKTPDGWSHYVKRTDVATVYLIPSYLVSDLARFTSDPPKPRPTPTPAPSLATPVGGAVPPAPGEATPTP